MKTKRVFLNELTTASENFKVKVKVIEKGRAQIGALRKLPYQGLLLIDDKGNKMRGALFGEQLRNFKDDIVYNGTYEIANATIKPMEDKYKKSNEELNYQMGFGSKTVIQPLNYEGGPVLPNYVLIGQIPKIGDPADKFDVLGVVLFVDKKTRQARLGAARTVTVSEILVMDHSTQQPLAISAWDDLADTASETLGIETAGLQIAGFTALKVSQHKGFSMTTTMSSEIIEEPAGEKAVAIGLWVVTNTRRLVELKSSIEQAKLVDTQKAMTTIAALREKRAQSTLQDEKYWLCVTVPSAEFKSLNAYLGCSKCGRQSNMAAQTIYKCPICNKDECTSTPRTVFSCEVTDGTGVLPITTFTNDTEKLFRLTAQDIFRIKVAEDPTAFEAAQNLLRATTYLIQGGPKNRLTRSNILEWVLKQVIVENQDGEDTSSLREDNSSEGNQTLKTTTLRDPNTEIQKHSGVNEHNYRDLGTQTPTKVQASIATKEATAATTVNVAANPPKKSQAIPTSQASSEAPGKAA